MSVGLFAMVQSRYKVTSRRDTCGIVVAVLHNKEPGLKRGNTKIN